MDYRKACKQGNLEIAKSLVPSNSPCIGYLIACRYGHLNIVKFMKPLITNENDIDTGFIYACRFGHIGIVEFLFPRMHVLNVGFGCACEDGHKDIIDLFISNKYELDWNKGLLSACAYKGNVDTINYVISKAHSYYVFDWNNGLRYACKGGHIDAVRLMISKGANDLDTALEFTLFGTMDMRVIDLLISKGANKEHLDDYTSDLLTSINMLKSIVNSDIIDYTLKFL
jgi:ankyrin repeat protein